MGYGQSHWQAVVDKKNNNGEISPKGNDRKKATNDTRNKNEREKQKKKGFENKYLFIVCPNKRHEPESLDYYCFHSFFCFDMEYDVVVDACYWCYYYSSHQFRTLLLLRHHGCVLNPFFWFWLLCRHSEYRKGEGKNAIAGINWAQEVLLTMCNIDPDYAQPWPFNCFRRLHTNDTSQTLPSSFCFIFFFVLLKPLIFISKPIRKPLNAFRIIVLITSSFSHVSLYLPTQLLCKSSHSE